MLEVRRGQVAMETDLDFPVTSNKHRRVKQRQNQQSGLLATGFLNSFQSQTLGHAHDASLPTPDIAARAQCIGRYSHNVSTPEIDGFVASLRLPERW